MATGLDVAQAEAQLEATRAQAIDMRARRAQVEHAIAVLVGHAGLDLLDRGDAARGRAAAGARRPARRRCWSGARTSRPPNGGWRPRTRRSAWRSAAFFPAITLTGSGRLRERRARRPAARRERVLDRRRPPRPGAVFDGGRRRAVSDQAKAGYERTVSLYRETTLTAFREVEDQLATLRVLDEEAAVQRAALAAAERALTLSTNRYRGGIATYLEVIIAQNAALTNRRGRGQHPRAPDDGERPPDQGARRRLVAVRREPPVRQ